MSTNFQNYYSGTSGLILPVANKLYYPEEFQNKSRLCYYASMMNSIEINSSFYKIPRISTVQNWAMDVPEDFRFTFKLFKEITHNQHLAFDPELLARFFSIISYVGNKKGCLLVQFPPSIRISHFSQLRFLMSLLRQSDPDYKWRIALEFRHPSLYVDEVYSLLEQFGLGMVIHDNKCVSSPVRDLGSEFIYLRFHGPMGNYRGSYDEKMIYEYASYVAEWLSEGKSVFAYFNNSMGQPHANLNLLSKILRREH